MYTSVFNITKMFTD